MPVGGPRPRGSCWLQGAAVGPVVKKTGSWALSSRPGSLTSLLSTGPRVKHLNPLTLSFLLVREICFLLGSFHRQGMSLRTLDPEELSTSPRLAQLTAALSVAEALVPRAWLRIQGAALEGAQRADGYLRGGMRVQKPQPLGRPGWVWAVHCLPALQLGMVWGWERLLCAQARRRKGR